MSKLWIGDALSRLKSNAWKQKKASAYVYYTHLQSRNTIAFNPFDTFKDSWAYESWFKTNKKEIEELVAERSKRFAERHWTI